MYNVLVTGVGAIIGYGIIRSLRTSGYPVKIVGIDIYSDAVGQNWCDNFEVTLPAKHNDFPEFIQHIVDKYSIDLVIPGIEQDVARLSTERAYFNNKRVKFALNNHELISVASDKWTMHQKLVDLGFPTIKTFISGEYQELREILGSPMLLKPRRSYASKGIRTIHTEDDFSYWQSSLNDNFMVQEIVGSDDEEYTVSAFGFGDGTCTSKKITFRRKLSGEGATAKAIVQFIPELDAVVDKLAEKFKPMGPTNFQFRKHKNEFLLLEINPRISSSTSLRTAFGFNEAKMCLEHFVLGKEIQIPTIKSGCATRFIEDMISYDSNNS